jgi:hypothetical protein
MPILVADQDVTMGKELAFSAQVIVDGVRLKSICGVGRWTERTIEACSSQSD